MTHRSLQRVATCLAFGLWALSLSACVVSVNGGQYSVREEKTFEVTGLPELSLATFDGSVEVRSWDRNQVRIEIEKRGSDRESAEAIEVVAEQLGNRITIEVKKPMGGGRVLRRSGSARVVATVPRQCNLVARTGDGSVVLERLEGKLDVSTGDGSLRGSDLVGSVRAQTGDGSVRFEHLDGSVEVETGDGGATLSGKLGVVRLRTGDGTVTVRAEEGSVMAGDWEVRTGDGSVFVELPEQFGASLDARTNDGRIRVEGLGTPDRPADEEGAGGQELKRSLGSGGKNLRLRSSSGSISVRRL
jgi:DUF4097 and DUF4098 domain-containing protein YvlB